MNVRWIFRWGTAILIALFLLPLIASAGSLKVRLAEIEPKVLQQLTHKDETSVWIILHEQADLSPAYAMRNWEARGRFVYERLRAVANRSQAGLRGLLQRRGALHRPFFIFNAIKVQADRAILRELAQQPEIEKIIADRVYQIPEPLPGINEVRVQMIEWNIDRINAPRVWSTFGVRGEGIVVASIDSGVQFDHPALVAQYRGNQGGGRFNHNYNWFDPSYICNPSLVPCDNNGHGTHTTGTMVGDDGDPGPNQIGVAPRAQWIAAKGCEGFICSFEDLMASAQWILAPTDLNGNNPRPDLRPHIVNNSWGRWDFSKTIVQAWIASGIFPVFANGNGGPNCSTSGSPGDYLESYSAGAFDINNHIASFSSRGPSAFGEAPKPNITAPGVDIRSSMPGNQYASLSGTSMAAPHVAGTVALIWSAAPALIGDIAGTRALLDQTAIDVSDPSCGGTSGKNNVWGEGRLDALAAVTLAPRGPTGTLRGTVTDARTGNAINSMIIQTVGPSNQTAFTDASGQYSLRLPIGTYDVTVSAFGYLSQTVTRVIISEDATATQNFALARAPSHAVAGHVRDTLGNPLANVSVSIFGTPIPPVITDAKGTYRFVNVPEGAYEVQAGGRCHEAQIHQLVVDGDETLDFALPQRSDAFGYFCEIVPPAYIEASHVLPLSGDEATLAVRLPFPFIFYGQTYTTAYVTTNGFLNFLFPDGEHSNGAIPSILPPNGAVYPYWDNLVVDGEASVRIELLGTAPNRQFVIEWRNVAHFGDFARRVDFEVVLYENGRILTQYRNIADNRREQGDSAMLGLEDETGKIAFQYAFNEPVIYNGLAVLYQSRTPPIVQSKRYLPLIMNMR
jgi:hypothetical protein